MTKQTLLDDLEYRIKFMEQVCLFSEFVSAKEMIETRTAYSLIDFGKYLCLKEIKKEIEENF